MMHLHKHTHTCVKLESTENKCKATRIIMENGSVPYIGMPPPPKKNNKNGTSLKVRKITCSDIYSIISQRLLCIMSVNLQHFHEYGC